MSDLKKDLDWKPLTGETWSEFEQLFGENGACGGCWCMWWRLTRSQFSRNGYEPNKQSMRAIVESGKVPGLLFYSNGVASAWVSVGRREDFPSLQRSRILAPVDDQPAWSIVCYYIPRQNRRKGWLLPMTLAACEYARSKGAHIIEAYPMVHEEKMPSTSAYMGVSSVLKEAGFEEVLRRSEYHPIMRKEI